jgi:hypothetical protein
MSNIKDFSNNEKELIKNLQKYYDKSKDLYKDFGGPSVYFHIKAINEQRRKFLSDRHIELIYATLTSWGLHRMGRTMTKLVEYSKFKDSILSQKDKFKKLKNLKIEKCNFDEYVKLFNEINDIYKNLKVSKSKSTVVGHSKTLSHILPDLIPPIDRQYTIRFFEYNKSDFFIRDKNYRQIYLPEDKERQFALFKEYACKVKMLFDMCYKENKRLFKLKKDTFNTSFPKIMDNLIITYIRNKK